MSSLSSEPVQPTVVPLEPVRQASKERAKFPTFLTRFIGREREISTVCNLLTTADARLVTLTGPGGVGKTRLALAIATKLAAEFRDGIAFVDLSSVRDPSLVLPAIAQALGVRDTTGRREAADPLPQFLNGKQLLLVLDNCEQITESAPQIGNLLELCPDLKIMATSRAVLRLSGEQVVSVPPLELPDLAKLPSLTDLSRIEAIAIFVQRAKAANPHFSLSTENAEDVAAICTRLDGIPLAIELAAARANLLSASALLGRLERSLPLLTAGARDAPARQRTLRETLAWSYDLLSADEQIIFRHAAIFAGGFTLDALEQTYRNTQDPASSDDIGMTVLDAVTSLVEHSLLRPDSTRDDESRFLMLETVREFGLELLAASQEKELVRQWHADWFLKVAESALPEYHGPRVSTVLDELEAESDNFRLALAWSIERNEARFGLRLAYGLWRFWWMHGHLTEGRSWLDRVLELSGGAPPDLRSRVLAAAGYFARIQGDLERARQLGEQGLALGKEHEDYHTMSGALDLLGLIAFDQGDYVRATAYHLEALALDRQQQNAHRIAVHCYNLAINALAIGDLDRAEAYFDETLSIWKSHQDAWGTARALIGLGRLAMARNDSAAATDLLFESLALSQSVGDKEQVANSLTELASLASVSNPLAATTIYGATAALRSAIGAPISPADRVRYDRALASVRSLVPASDFESAWQAGLNLPPEDAIDRVRELFEASTITTRSTTGLRVPEPETSGITARELQVLRLLAAGRSNTEIAEELSISVLTAKTHVSRILTKLDLPSRAAAVAYVHNHNLA